MIKASELRLGNWVDCNVAGMITIPELRNKAYNPDALRILKTFKDTKLRVGSVFDGGAGCGQGYPNETGLVYFAEDHMHGIPLTDEWLGRLGLVRQAAPMLKDRPEYRNWRISLSPQGDPPRDGNYFEIYFWWDICAKEVWLGRRQFYVHEVQNLYFTLVGKELTVKL